MKIQKFTSLVYLATMLILQCWGDWCSEIENDLASGLEEYAVTFTGKEENGCLLTKGPEELQDFTTKLCNVCNQHPETKIIIDLQNVGFLRKEVLIFFLNELAKIENLYRFSGWIYVDKDAIDSKTPTFFKYIHPNKNLSQRNLSVLGLAN